MSGYLDMTEEGIAKALTFAGSLHQAGNVGDVEEGGDLAGRLVVFHQPIEPLIRHRHPAT